MSLLFDECHFAIEIREHVKWDRARNALSADHSIESDHSCEDEDELPIESDVFPSSDGERVEIREKQVTGMNRGFARNSAGHHLKVIAAL